MVHEVSPWAYAASQPGVILHYLRLSVWPEGQCLDYGWPVATSAAEILPPLVVVVLLMGWTLWAVWRIPVGVSWEGASS